MRQNILITGASAGLGAGMARAFAAMGRNLALCARRVDALEALKRDLETTHPDIRVVARALDVTKHDDVFSTFQAFEDDLGRIDRVIVNAGLGKGQPLGTGYFYANKQTAQTNFLGARSPSARPPSRSSASRTRATSSWSRRSARSGACART